MRPLFLLFILLSFQQIYSQNKTMRIDFVPVWQGKTLQLNQTYWLGKDSFQLDGFRFYVSSFTFYKGPKRVKKNKDAFLLDAATNHLTCQVKKPAGKFDAVGFTLGIDSLTNVSGAMGGDLDPAKGMYWTWQSGYINFKLEGRSSLCTKSNCRFEFHIGGYNGEQNASQHLSFPVKDPNQLIIHVSLDRFFSSIDFLEKRMVMSPGTEAVSVAQLLAKSFISAP